MPRGFALVVFALGLAAPAFPQSLKDRAQTFYEQGKFVEAARTLERHLGENPEDFQARLLLGLCYQQAGDPLASAAAYQQAADQRPNDSIARFRLAQAQYFAGKFAYAEKNARASLRLGGAPAYIHNLIGLVLEQKHNYEQALAAYDVAIQGAARDYGEPYLNAGILLLRLDRAAEALERLHSATEINPRSHEALYYRARAYLATGKVPQAKKDLEQAVSVGNHQPARQLLNRLRSGRLERPVVSQKALKSLAPIRFRNVAKTAGLDFVLENHPTSQKHIIETMTGGVAAFDYDYDGLTDIFFTNGAEIPSLKKAASKYFNRLYRNEGDMKFRDVTEQAGAQGRGYSMGAAAADYDNDGNVDLFVAGVNRNTLYRNTGRGRFEDVTSQAGITSNFWSVAAGWFDYDNDGWLDLFVVNYLKWSASMDEVCGDHTTKVRSYCDPTRFEGLPNTLYRNRGDGSFEDVTERAGISVHVGKGMSVAFADYNEDGFVDVFVTNDTVPNFLFLNRGDGTFEEVAMAAGVGLTDDGQAISSMGVDFRDYDNDGLPDLTITALARETFPLFRNEGEGFFRDVTYPSRMGMLSVKRSGWGNGLFDFNNDGWKDLFSANSHVLDNVEEFRPDSYRQPNTVFANLGDGTFREASRGVGESFQQPRAHRGAAFADFNNDGRIDVVVTSLREPVELWENVSATDYHWLLISLEGAKSNRDGIGVRVQVGNQHNHMTTSVGYASSSHHGVHFGLGNLGHVEKIRIFWPSGVTQVLEGVKADQVLRIKEPK